MLDLALVHYPVCNKRQEVIGSAVTNLDIHDIARAGKTFGVHRLYIVTPYPDQQDLVRTLLEHWSHGYGATYNQDRKEALSIVEVIPTLDDLFEAYSQQGMPRPCVIATSASRQDRTVHYDILRARLESGEHCLFLFGTGWGLAPELMNQVDAFLPPIGQDRLYNHLSVRSACAIILDRVLGDR